MARLLSVVPVSAEAVAAAAAWVQAVAVVSGVGVALWQLREARGLRRDQGRAYVFLQFTFPAEHLNLPHLTITNLGSTEATDVKISFDPPLQSSLDKESKIADVGWIRDGIPMLPPGGSFTTLYESLFENTEALDRHYSATVTYTDRFGEAHAPVFPLDLRPYVGAETIAVKTVHDIHGQLVKLVSVAERIQTKELTVVTETREAQQSRLDAERAARAERQERDRAELEKRKPTPAED